MADQDNLSPAVSSSETEQLKKALKASRALNRRTFMAGLGLTGAAIVAGAGCGSDNPAGVVQGAPAFTDADIFNFALNLEYFEATLYSYLVTGSDISSSLTGGTGTAGAVTNPPAQLTGLPNQVQDLLGEVLFDEISHVQDIRAVLTSAAVARPALNLGALGTITGSNYLSFARLIEDVGVTAYAGAAPLITMSTNLQYAAQILAVEAFHSGAFRTLAIQTGAAYPTADAPHDGYDIIPADPGTPQLAQAGPTTAHGGFFATAGAANATTAESNVFPGMAYSRSLSQVLAIVYGSTTAGTTSGGFFPSGMNANVASFKTV